MNRRGLLLDACAGAGAALAARALLSRVLLLKLRRDVQALNAGDYQPVLSNYAQDAVLRFNEGEHRWAGEHRGRAAIALFLQSFVDAGLQGHVSDRRARQSSRVGAAYSGPAARSNHGCARAAAMQAFHV